MTDEAAPTTVESVKSWSACLVWVCGSWVGGGGGGCFGKEWRGWTHGGGRAECHDGAVGALRATPPPAHILCSKQPDHTQRMLRTIQGVVWYYDAQQGPWGV
jgi:hypothetical protein